MNSLGYGFSQASYFHALQCTSKGSPRSSYLQLLSLIVYFSKLAQKSGDAHKDFTLTAYLPPEIHAVKLEGPGMGSARWPITKYNGFFNSWLSTLNLR